MYSDPSHYEQVEAVDSNQLDRSIEWQGPRENVGRVPREVQRYYAPLNYEGDPDSQAMSGMVRNRSVGLRGGTRSQAGGKLQGQARPKFYRHAGVAAAHRGTSATPQGPRTVMRTSDKAGQDSLLRNFKDAMEASKGAFNYIRGEQD